MSVTEFELLTSRLRLRMPVVNDAEALQAIAADPRVALTTALIPYPYPPGGALAFIEWVRSTAGPDTRNLAITLPSQGELIGMVGYVRGGNEAELSYMVSPAHWRRGYATEAASRLIAYILSETPFTAVVARVMIANPASEAVLRKAGLRWEREADVQLPLRGGVFPTSFWRLHRADFTRPRALQPIPSIS
jgi:ribosomal-protein-alanine N-acetyltransferase